MRASAICGRDRAKVAPMPGAGASRVLAMFTTRQLQRPWNIATCAHFTPHPHDTRKSIAKMASGRAPSQTPVPTTETAESAGASSTVSAAEWEGMASLLKNVYDYRDAESVLLQSITGGV
jgi:hypothetical protein